jgi:hypothetical protein
MASQGYDEGDIKEFTSEIAFKAADTEMVAVSELGF